jgi:hypothetical protein
MKFFFYRINKKENLYNGTVSEQETLLFYAKLISCATLQGFFFKLIEHITHLSFSLKNKKKYFPQANLHTQFISAISKFSSMY